MVRNSNDSSINSITAKQEKRYKYLLGDTDLLERFLKARRSGEPIFKFLLDKPNKKKDNPSSSHSTNLNFTSTSTSSFLSKDKVQKVHRHQEFPGREERETRGGNLQNLEKESKGKSRKSNIYQDEMEMEMDQQEDEEISFMFTESPPYIKNGTMKPYQIQGLNWLISLHDHQINGILADEMGLGKTLQTLSLLGYLKNYCQINGPHCLIVPKSTLNNWLNECNRWTPDLRAFILIGDKDERKDIFKDKFPYHHYHHQDHLHYDHHQDHCDNYNDNDRDSNDTTIGNQKTINHEIKNNNFDICITSYEMCLLEKAQFKKIKWHYLVIDEAHRIKNEQSLLSKIVREFKSNHRLLLTGTPLQNNLHELWALLNFLLPDIFPNSSDFDSWIEDQQRENNPEQNNKIIEQLRRLLEPFLLRRLKSDVEHSLAPKKEINLYVGMSAMQKSWYKRILERDLFALSNSGVTKVRLANIVMQLRKCVNHPYLFDGAEPGPPFITDERLVVDSEKIRILDKLLARLKSNGSRVLLFSQMSRMLDILEDYCIMRDYAYCRLDGQTSHEDRITGIRDFNHPSSDKFIFLLTTRAGGLGINLATADIVILYDSDWNPQVDLQAQDRAHRIGQQKQVYVFRLISENSIEEKILEKAMQKLRLDQLIIQQGKFSNINKPLSQDEMLAMIQHGAEEILMDTPSNKTSNHANNANNHSSNYANNSIETNNSNREIQIEDIIKKGEEKTMELQKKYQNAGLSDLDKFRLDSTIDNLQPLINQVSNRMVLIDAPRERKAANYLVDGYYREIMGLGPSKPKSNKIPMPKNYQQVYDFQFFPPEYLELKTRQVLAFQKSVGYVVAAAVTEPSIPSNSLGSSTLQSGTISQSKEEINSIESRQKRELEQSLIDNSIPLTDKEMNRMELLAEEGFSNWTKRDYSHYLKGLEKHGKNWEMIASEMIGEKSLEEIKAYSLEFLNRFEELNDCEKIRNILRKTELRLERVVRIKALLQEKSKWKEKHPNMKLSLVYKEKDREFTEEEDEFMILQMNEIGYDREDLYEQLRERILRESIFRFNWFIKTRTMDELMRRCQKLIGILEKRSRERNEKQRK